MSIIEPFFKLKEQPTNKIPKITINSTNFSTLVKLVQSQEHEIMLFGVVQRTKTEDYYISQWLIPPQTDNTSAFVTTDDENYPKWLISLPREVRQNLRLHLHTHPKMSTNPSGVDQSTILAKVQDIDDFYIRMIINHKLEMHIDLYELNNHLLYKEMPLYVGESANDPYYLKVDKDGIRFLSNVNIEDLQKELQTKIKVKTYSYSHYGERTSYNSPSPIEKEIENEELLDLYGLVSLATKNPKLTIKELRSRPYIDEIDILEEITGYDFSKIKEYDQMTLLNFLKKYYPMWLEENV